MSIKNFKSTHTCDQHGANAGNSMVSRKFIASQIQVVLKVRPDLRVVDIKNGILSNFGININYSKTWWGKETAQQDLFGDDDNAYGSLRWYVLFYSSEITLTYESMVHATNPESLVVIDADDGRFKCRPILFLDGTSIKDRYRGILLSATEYDGNQGIFPLLIVYDDDMKELVAIDHKAYVTVMKYSPDRWANAYFPGIRYDNVTSNVVESFNSWIRNA
ncbi:uncharacterized protein LOC109827324 [Asparagus officinalis]|uniref:uncharacterized protein LOC109827324 n=1 Tax=Asparagus officinalis TaxID=4686 RepID=UPI00098DEB7F|nr:uncharacterized protein LOC109827324 [Asparagus officinalis]